MTFSMRLAKIFKVRSTETRMVFLVVGLMYFPAMGVAIGSPGVEALFYTRFGVQFLPYMYIGLGIVTLATSLIITGLLARVARERLYTLLPLFLMAFLIISRVAISFDLSWYYPVLWLGMNILWVIQGLFTWGIAGIVCDTRQAKRLFPLFGAGYLLGLALGGMVTQPLVHLINTENLLLVWGGGLLVAFAIGQRLVGTPKGAPKFRSYRKKSVIDEIRQGYAFTRHSPLLQWIALASIFFAVLYYSLVFPFSKAVAQEFPDEHALAGFLGTFQGICSTATILISLFLANRLYARFGIMTTILVYPIIYLIGFSVVTIIPIFIPLAVFRFIQILWADGIAQGANQAMFNVVPGQKREQTRTFIRGVANQFGISLAGGLLILSEHVLRPQHVFLIGAIFGVVTTILVLKARRAYGLAVVDTLRAGQPQLFFSDEQPFGGFPQDAAAVAIVVEGLSSPEANIRRISAEILGNLSIQEATRAIVDALEDPDPFVRVALLRSLGQSKTSSALLEVVACLEDPEPEVRLQAIETIQNLTNYPRGIVTQIEPLLDDPIPVVRARVATALLQSNSYPRARDAILEMANGEDANLRMVGIEALGELGGQEAYDLAMKGLNDPLPPIRRVAASILAQIDPHQCIHPLINALGDEDETVRDAAATALGRVGEPALHPTIAALSNPATEVDALRALEKLPVQQASKDIRKYALERVYSALEYHDLWLQSQLNNSRNERYDLLASALREKSLLFGTNALRAAGLLGDLASISLAIDNLQSPNPNQRANAIETLETLGDSEIVSLSLQLWDSSDEAPEKREGWLIRLLEDPDPWLRACSALVVQKMDDHHMTAILQRMADSDPVSFVSEVALKALNGDDRMDTLPTLSLLERVLFLRRVPLFANLSSADLSHIAAITGEHYFVDGETIAEQGELGDEMYIITSGEIEVIAEAADGKSIHLARRKPGEYVGEMAIISDEPRMASLIALGDVRCLCVEQKQFEGILRSRPETSLAVMRVLSERLRESIPTTVIGESGEKQES